jgi:hypothetical protein
LEQKLTLLDNWREAAMASRRGRPAPVPVQPVEQPLGEPHKLDDLKWTAIGGAQVERLALHHAIWCRRLAG